MKRTKSFEEFIQINEAYEKSSLRNHVWNEEDAILTLYYVKFGLDRLPVQNEKELAEWIIGSTVGSLNMQAANIRYLLGYPDGVLTDFSAAQKAAVNKYGDATRGELEYVVNEIIDNRDFEENKKTIEAKLKAKRTKEYNNRLKEINDRQRDNELRRLGKDPSKMKSLGKRKKPEDKDKDKDKDNKDE